MSAPTRGLSPRVRGNPQCREWSSAYLRSIPARAGEPSQALAIASQAEVYPRACGGTDTSVSRHQAERGLSPRVRGNRPRRWRSSPKLRSIPARAGEPSSWTMPPAKALVYPRACGGTTCVAISSITPNGLSPRVRGNRACLVYYDAQIRSIPARAGEPVILVFGPRFLRVYPRACGGTS